MLPLLLSTVGACNTCHWARDVDYEAELEQKRKLHSEQNTQRLRKSNKYLVISITTITTCKAIKTKNFRPHPDLVFLQVFTCYSTRNRSILEFNRISIVLVSKAASKVRWNFRYINTLRALRESTKTLRLVARIAHWTAYRLFWWSLNCRECQSLGDKVILMALL